MSGAIWEAAFTGLPPFLHSQLAGVPGPPRERHHYVQSNHAGGAHLRAHDSRVSMRVSRLRKAG